MARHRGGWGWWTDKVPRGHTTEPHLGNNPNAMAEHLGIGPTSTKAEITKAAQKANELYRKRYQFPRGNPSGRTPQPGHTRKTKLGGGTRGSGGRHRRASRYNPKGYWVRTGKGLPAEIVKSAPTDLGVGRQGATGGRQGATGGRQATGHSTGFSTTQGRDGFQYDYYPTGPSGTKSYKGHGASPAGRKRREIKNQQRDIKKQQGAIKRRKKLEEGLADEKVRERKSKEFFGSRRSWESGDDWKTRQQREDEAVLLGNLATRLGKRP